MKTDKLFTSLAATSLLGAMLTVQASGLTINPFDGSVGAAATGSSLTNAVQAPSSGITVVPSSISYQGTTGQGQKQSATYTGFSLAPSSGSSPILTLPDGILLTSGTSILPTTNTVNNYSNSLPQPGSGSNAQLSTLSGKSTNDANALTFQFTVAPGVTSIDSRFVFGTDEFPTQSVTDIFGFFVDGVNYAQFPSGELISNTPGSPTNFVNNPVGGGLYPIEYNGLTSAYNLTGLLNPSLTTHTLTIGVADTNDTIYDSGVFIGGLKAGTASGGGGISEDVPDGGFTLTMLGVALGGLAGLRHKLSA